MSKPIGIEAAVREFLDLDNEDICDSINLDGGNGYVASKLTEIISKHCVDKWRCDNQALTIKGYQDRVKSLEFANLESLKLKLSAAEAKLQCYDEGFKHIVDGIQATEHAVRHAR